MRRSPALHPVVILVALAFLVACGGEDPDREPAPRPLETGVPGDLRDERATAETPAPDLPSDPRLVLFDVKTALESARPTQDGYPLPDAFRYEERWRLQRQRLDAAFDEWDYRSDGESFTLRGVHGDRAYDVSGP